MLIGICVAIFIFTSAIVYTLSLRTVRSSQGLQKRLGRMLDSGSAAAGNIPLSPAQSPLSGAPDMPKATSAAAGRPDLLPVLTRMLSGRAIEKKMRLEMVKAGWRLRPGEFIGLCLACALGLAIVGLMLLRSPVIAVAFGIAGLMAPHLALRQQQAARRSRFDAQLPDAMTLIASSLRSGYSFLKAMQLVVDEMPKPISEEFAWVMGEASLGMAIETALERMVEHIGSKDLELIVVAVSINLQVGGNLAEILDTISGTIRERMRIQGEIKSLTAEGKLSGLVLFVLPLALKLKDPDYFKPLLESPYGMMIIGGAMVAQVLGGIIIQKMVALDV